MQVEAFVAESTAAVFRYYTEYRHLHRVAVFDWGGGTLDISVVEFRQSGIFEIGLGGTPTAGNALDREIALNLHARIMRERGQTRPFDEMDPHDQSELLFRSEEVKRQLASKSEVTLAMGAYAGHPVHIEVTRASLRSTLLPAVTEAVSLLEATIHRAGLSVDGIDTILLIGGSSQLWLLREELASDPRFAGRWQLAESPEWDVAHGAALLSRQPGAYALAETLDLKLANGSRIQLARPGDAPGAPERSLSLVLIEDAPEAHLVIERRGDSMSATAPALQFSAPTLGFLEEEITLRYGLTADLTFSAAATSARFSSEGKPYEIEDLRFGYALSQAPR
jgi:molecular chaperone DnaK